MNSRMLLILGVIIILLGLVRHFSGVAVVNVSHLSTIVVVIGVIVAGVGWIMGRRAV